MPVTKITSIIFAGQNKTTPMKLINGAIFIFLMISSQLVYDFSKQSNLKEWSIVDDSVMGGQSAGSFQLNSSGHAVFEGAVSLANNGGFSSVRYRMNKTMVTGYSKIAITIKGDAKNYQFRIRANSKDYYSFITTFSTSGEWQEIEIPLNQLYPSYRGRNLDIPNFSSSYFEEITFLIANKKNENFKLIIDKIELKK
ncbi:MAG: NADH dehydrogenase [ubiquinone] 1 alpha subcomplex assembly factor 1 [Salibacteraceae bacterium]